jgi:hypothetical protein
MHAPDPPDAKRKGNREANRLAKRAQRAREANGIRRASIYYSPVVIKALIAQSVDAWARRGRGR